MITVASNLVFISVLLFSSPAHLSLFSGSGFHTGENSIRLFVISFAPRTVAIPGEGANSGATNSQSDRRCPSLRAVAWGLQLFGCRSFAYPAPPYCVRSALECSRSHLPWPPLRPLFVERSYRCREVCRLQKADCTLGHATPTNSRCRHRSESATPTAIRSGLRPW